ncbi:putative Phytocyanin domain, cupredoxin [Helianthus annuus]|uniref:Phytocyanin domain, cupredoxin n=1 Tax=Helianthus annuus TaxID=4232 RepID=A0A9K3EM40_HELAN|nr:putative Phytocyanin domain, cupredoxin [Helianthus annuus]KAJ0503878.1 putative Phytocyanin domain, cupredoxin [Helianthus annuus]KAJ0724253.1 putative Phytocyanin domain, cupredoxin [Helianthus annuus]
MASLRLTFTVVTTIVIACMHFPTTLAVTSYVVGGAKGWSMPQNPNHYEAWTKGKKFIKGDHFYWVIKERKYNVGEVSSKEAYDTCNTTAVIPPVFDVDGFFSVLYKVKIYYFICTIHCSKGMKVAIDIKES